MANKSNRVTLTALREAIKGRFDTYITDTWCGLDITIKRYLDLNEALAFITKVVESSFDESGEYAPERQYIAMRLVTIALYTNLSLPKSIEEQYDLIYGTDLYSFVADRVDEDQYNSIALVILDRIKDINSVKAASVEARLADVYATVKNMQQQMSDIFNGVDAETINKLAGAMVNTQLDEEKLVRAIVDTHNGNN